MWDHKVIWGIQNHVLQLGCKIYKTHTCNCLFGINRKEIMSENRYIILYFYLLIATLTGVLMTRPFVYCGSLPGDFELVAKLTQNSHTQKKILKEWFLVP